MSVIHLKNFERGQIVRTTLTSESKLAPFVDNIILKNVSITNRSPQLFGEEFRRGLANLRTALFSSARNRERDRKIAYPIFGIHMEEIQAAFAGCSKADEFAAFTYWYLGKTGILAFDSGYDVVSRIDFQSATPNSDLLFRMFEAASFAVNEFLPRAIESVEKSRMMISDPKFRYGSVIPTLAVNNLATLSVILDERWITAGPHVTYKYEEARLMILGRIKHALLGRDSQAVLMKYVCGAELEYFMGFANVVQDAIDLPDSRIPTVTDDGFIKWVTAKAKEAMTGYLANWLTVSEGNACASLFLRTTNVTIPKTLGQLRMLLPSDKKVLINLFTFAPGFYGVRVIHNPQATAVVSSIVEGVVELVNEYVEKVATDEVIENFCQGSVLEDLSASMNTEAMKLIKLDVVMKSCSWPTTHIENDGHLIIGFHADAAMDDTYYTQVPMLNGECITDSIDYAFSRLVSPTSISVDENPIIAKIDGKISSSTEYSVDMMKNEAGKGRIVRFDGALVVKNAVDITLHCAPGEITITDHLRIIGIYTDKLSHIMSPSSSAQLEAIKTIIGNAMNWNASIGTYSGAATEMAHKFIALASSIYGSYYENLFDANHSLRKAQSPARVRKIKIQIKYNATVTLCALLDSIYTGLGSAILQSISVVNASMISQQKTIFDFNQGV